MFALLKNFFFGAGSRKEETTSPEQQKADSYRMLIECLQAASAALPEGKAYIVQANGEFTVSLTWKPEEGGNAPSRIYGLDGSGKVSRWEESGRPDLFVEAPDEENVPVKDETAKAADPEKAEEKEEKEEEKEEKEEEKEKTEKPSRQQLMMQRLVRHLKLRYAFRYNRLTERTECARLDPEAVEDSHHLTYKPVDTRTLNSISLDAISEGIDCWDRDVKRYIESGHISAYHPFTLYFDRLPAWDGKDRVSDLAKRVSDKELWINSFHRWMLAVTAQWMNFGNGGQRANSVAPILISTRQGMGKSTFCRILLPKPLQDYFTESFDLTNASGAENKLASYGLINLDEFDRLPASRMPQLKNLMQMESLRVRRAYKRNAEPLPRIASFIGTSNRTDLLTDLSGSRRFICVEVTRQIDCTTPIDYDQLYAQLKHELEAGERSWFSKEEEAGIQAANRAFYRVTPAEELIGTCFRFAEPGEEGAHLLSAAEIYATLKKKNPAALKDCSCTAFSRLLAQVGRRVHTKYGNGYWVKSLS